MSIVKPYTFVAGNKARANEVNEDFDVLYQQVNANITNIANVEGDIQTLSSTKANVNGASTQRFAVADPVSSGDAVNKRYLLKNGLPIGFVTFCAIADVPDGYLICDGSDVSRTSYSDLFNVIGTTFGAGDGSTTFTIPDLLGKFIQGETVVGVVRNAGLPNITGTFDAYELTGDQNNYRATGCFYGSTSGWAGGAGADDKSVVIHFDASRSNSIYGNSTTVQPPALTLLPIIKY